MSKHASSGMLNSTSVPESSSLPPPACRRQLWRVRAFAVAARSCPARPSSLSSFGSISLSIIADPPTEAAVRHTRISTSTRSPGRAGRQLRSASPRSGRLRPAGSDGGFARAFHCHTNSAEFGLLSSPASSSPRVFNAKARSLVSIVEERNPCTASRPSVIACAADRLRFQVFVWARPQGVG